MTISEMSEYSMKFLLSIEEHIVTVKSDGVMKLWSACTCIMVVQSLPLALFLLLFIRNDHYNYFLIILLFVLFNSEVLMTYYPL